MAVAQDGQQGSQAGGMKAGAEETPQGGAKSEGAGNPVLDPSSASAKSLTGVVAAFSGLKKSGGGSNSKVSASSRPSGGDDEPVFEDDLPLGTEAISYTGDGGSGEHVDLLLQGRQLDPEQVLVSLGFAPQLDSPPPVSRIPARFLVAPSRAAGITLDEFFSEYPDLHPSVPASWRKRAALPRAAAGWRAARTMSSVLSGARAFGSLHAAVTARRSATPPPPAAPGPHAPPPTHPSSILHPDNQKYLASKGFYNNQGGPMAADATERRQKFRSSKSKRPWSLVDARTEEEGEGGRRGGEGEQDEWEDTVASVRRNGASAMLEDTATPETGETSGATLLSSTDTCSSDSLLMSEESPQTSSAEVGRSAFDFGLSSTLDNLVLPDLPSTTPSAGGIGNLRKEQVERLMTGAEDGMDYQVSPSTSRQGSRQGSRQTSRQDSRQDSRQTSRQGSRQDSLQAGGEGSQVTSRVQTLCWKGANKNVRIVVSNARSPQPTSPAHSDLDLADGHVTEGMHLSISPVSGDRLSDTESGSEYTVVDQHASMDSGDPRLLREDVVRNGKREHARDENDNLRVPPRHVRAGDNTAQNGLACDENELPRMDSKQSDSSGFGDGELGTDLSPLEADRLRVTRMGSSGESAATLRLRDSLRDSLRDCVLDCATQTSNPSSPLRDASFSPLDPPSNPPDSTDSGWAGGQGTLSHSTAMVLTPSPLLTRHQQAGREAETSRERQSFMTVCFIPPLRQAASSSVTRQHSGATVAGENLVLGKTRVSVVIPETADLSRGRADRPRVPSSSSNHDRVPSNHDRFPSNHDRVFSNQDRFPSNQDRVSRRPDIFRARERSLAEELSDPQGSQEVLDSPLEAQWESYTKGDNCYAKGDNCHVSVLNLSVTSSERGSRFSVLEAEGSDCSYCSTGGTSSAASHVGSEALDYRKLLSLLNQPLTYKGRKRKVTSYRPKRHVRDWVGLVKKQRLQEETRLMQQALRRYDTELHVMETEFLLQYQTAASELSRDEREEVEEMRFLWTEIQQQTREMEQLLEARMKAVSAGNDCFTPLSSLALVGKMVELLKEQMYQQRLAPGEEEEELAELPPPAQRHLAASWWALGPATPPGPWTGSPYVPPQPSPDQQFARSMQELRGSLMTEFRQELRHSTQQLHLDIKARDNEIKRLQLEILQEKIKQGARSAQKPRSRPSQTLRSTQSTPSKLRETTV